MANQRKGRRRNRCNPLNNEQGAALLIAMLAVVLMTVIGVVLLQVVRTGLIHSAAAEAEIRAEVLAQNGLDEALMLLRNAVDYGNAQGDTYRKRIDEVENFVMQTMEDASDNSVSNKGVFTAESDYGKYTVDFSLGSGLDASEKTHVIRKFDAATKPSPDTPFVYQVVVRSTGETSGSPKRKITKQMRVFISTINPTFRYPVSADEGIRLGGAPYIIGDIFAKDELYVSNQASFIDGPSSYHEATSGYPSMKGFVHVLSGQYVSDDYSGGFRRDLFQHEKPFEDIQLAKGLPVGVATMVGQKVGDAEALTAADPTISPTFSGYMEGAAAGRDTVGTEGTATGVQYKEGEWVTVNGDWTVYGDVIVDNGALRVHQASDSEKVVIRGGSLYVEMDDRYVVAANLSGCLNLSKLNNADELNPEAFVVVKGNATLTNFNFNGSMFVQGDLKVIGDLNINGSLYVDGDVEMKEMRSVNQSINTCGTFANKPVIVMSSGKIILSDNQADATTEQINIRAFLYSEEDLKMYGVRSKLHIDGGMHGKNVELNAMRGNYSKDATGEFTNPGITPPLPGYYFTNNQSQLLPEQSRLQVIYDLSLYTNPPDGIPVTEKVNVFVHEITSDR